MKRILSWSLFSYFAFTVIILLVTSRLSVAVDIPATPVMGKQFTQRLINASEKKPIVRPPSGKARTIAAEASVKTSALAKPLTQAKRLLKQKKIKQAVTKFATIVLQKRTSVEDAKIQLAAATALAKLQRKGSPHKIQKHTLLVTSTAYSSHVNQTDDTPWIAAWGDRLKDGMKIIAVSNDLLKMGLGRGSLVKIHGIPGNFVVLDKMNRRWRKRIDIYTGGNLKAARRWGTQSQQISFLTGLDNRSHPTISRKHYDYKNAKKYPLSPLQKALSKLKIRCNRQRPSCKKWIFLKRKKILARFSGK